MIYENKHMGINTWNVEQGTPEWLKARSGVITASVAHAVIKRGRGKDGYSAERATLMMELVAQICTGVVPESISFKQAEWGHENEPYAREAFEAATFETVETCGFIYKDDSLRCGISPDGISDLFGLEIKNPFTTPVHLATLLNGEIKPEYVTQCQYSMWVTGYKLWNFCSYDHRMRGKPENRLCIIPIYQDDELMEKFDVEIPKFITEMDEILAKLGFKFGDQWVG
jgi:predicted phage-related endonuclease